MKMWGLAGWGEHKQWRPVPSAKNTLAKRRDWLTTGKSELLYNFSQRESA